MEIPVSVQERQTALANQLRDLEAQLVRHQQAVAATQATIEATARELSAIEFVVYEFEAAVPKAPLELGVPDSAAPAPAQTASGGNASVAAANRRPRRNVRELILDCIRAAGPAGVTVPEIVARVPEITTASVDLALTWYSDPKHGVLIAEIPGGRWMAKEHLPTVGELPRPIEPPAEAEPVPAPTDRPRALFNDEDDEQVEPSTIDLQRLRALLREDDCTQEEIEGRGIPFAAVRRGLEEGWISGMRVHDQPAVYRLAQAAGERAAAE